MKIALLDHTRKLNPLNKTRVTLISSLKRNSKEVYNLQGKKKSKYEATKKSLKENQSRIQQSF